MRIGEMRSGTKEMGEEGKDEARVVVDEIEVKDEEEDPETGVKRDDRGDLKGEEDTRRKSESGTSQQEEGIYPVRKTEDEEDRRRGRQKETRAGVCVTEARSGAEKKY